MTPAVERPRGVWLNASDASSVSLRFSLVMLVKCGMFHAALPVGRQISILCRDNLLIMQERWMCVEEIATQLGVNRDTNYKWIERKKMPAHKVGRPWKFLGTDVDRWVKRGATGQ